MAHPYGPLARPQFTRQTAAWAVAWAAVLAPLLLASCVLFLVQVRARGELHRAAEDGDVGQLAAILDRHPDRLEERDKLQFTLLHSAAWHGQPRVVAELVRRGADVEATWDLARTGDGGWTALHLAATVGEVETARALVAAGAAVNRRTVRGETPLDVAVRHGQPEVAAYLRSRGGVHGEPH